MRRLPGQAESPGFPEFWTAYPRHEGKAAALRAWTKLRPDEPTREAIHEAIAWQRASGCLQPAASADGRSLIPHAATWLNGRRWEDEPSPTPAPTDRIPALHPHSREAQEERARRRLFPDSPEAARR